MKKILITGSQGMVGRNLVFHFSASASNIELLTPNRQELNLSDFETVKRYIRSNRPDAIIHCAGKVGGIQANIRNPYDFMYENMSMGSNLVHAAKQENIKYLINLGSSCMYPRNANNPLKEESILKGELEPTNEGYAVAKIAIAKMCEYANKEGYTYKTLIPCNLYGYWDKFEPEKSHMVPAIIYKIYRSKMNNDSPIEIWGTGNARREFMFVEDLADFIYYCLHKMESLPDMMNVGLGYDHSVIDYYLTAKKVIGSEAEFYFDTTKPEGMKQKVVDITEQKKLGWQPKTDICTGIEKTFKHYLEQHT